MRPEFPFNASVLEDQRGAEVALGRLSGEVIGEIVQSGAIRALLGGPQPQLESVADFLRRVAAHSLTAAWTASIYCTGAWLASCFGDLPDPGPSHLTSVSLAPTGMLRAEPDGLKLDGTWSFATGFDNADTTVVGCFDAAGHRCMVIVPNERFSAAGEWSPHSLHATSSRTITLTDVEVEPSAVVRTEPAGNRRTGVRSDSTAYDTFPLFSTLNFAPLLGAVDAAIERVSENASRTISFTQRPRSTSDLFLADLGKLLMDRSAGESVLKMMVEEAETMRKTSSSPTLEQRALFRARAAWISDLAQRAADIAVQSTGSSALKATDPAMRTQQEVTGLRLHGALGSPESLRVLGRVHLGLDPDSVFL